MPVVIVHMLNEDPVMGEMEELPNKTDTVVYVDHPRRRDGKDISYLEPNVNTVIWPMARVSFIEIIPGADDEKIVSFVRE